MCERVWTLPLGERLHRELQRSPARRAARRRNLLHAARGPNRHRELAVSLQHDQAARIARIQAACTGGICPCLRRVAGCATPTGSAGHAGATARLKLTFHLDHSVGANQYLPICAASFLLTASQLISPRWRCSRRLRTICAASEKCSTICGADGSPIALPAARKYSTRVS